MSADKTYKNIKTKAGRQLYDLLPEVYRSRDSSESKGQGDLAKFLDACGELLDLLRNTLDQRLADSFPDNPQDGRDCQAWLLPYFAELLDVRLVSPDEKGRRDEVANAVAWRQRKGTRTAAEQIAEAVSQTEVEVQEGWKRVATTPRIGMPLLPAKALGESEFFDDYREHPVWAARHPGLPSVTVDLRYPSRAMQLGVEPDEFSQNPAAKLTSFAGKKTWWRQVNFHGAPCFPGSYEDIARRSVDLRTPNWKQGHFHPKRALLFAPPPEVFFAPDIISIPWQERFYEQYAGLFEEQEEGGVWVFRAKTVQPLCIHGVIDLEEEKAYRFEKVRIDDELFVHQGRLELFKVAARHVEVRTIDTDEPVLEAADSLFNTVQAARGLARLEYCTILGKIECNRLQASDSLFVGELKLDPGTDEDPHCIRYSRIPAGFSVRGLLTYQNTIEAPIFYDFEFDEADKVVQRCSLFGEPGCAVLHPATPEAIRFGAEDGGEIGAHHTWRHSLLLAAVQDKLKDFLPVGIEAVLVPDLRLHRLPALPCENHDS
jgi:hypothetical protein